MDQVPYSLDAPRRAAVLTAIQGVCSYRNWSLLAAHVRSTHVHVVVRAEDKPEKVMNDFKSYASRELNNTGLDQKDRRRWARHGSTRWLHANKEVDAAIHYVLHEQGEPMAVFERPYNL